ncbi:exodeoxyribonuclease V subunit alpha [Alteromonas sp. BL110]|uniref:exodeoxyribonuclease V subunit alpha n=1 Tax=Alteromonas sp. BL110 TaxID=1714845 RepID=UPI000E4E459C|nr:exodeoxyribonuclease V subunit alpha [Alteromonas sp. BL110]AXT40040.1 exodeoxyribonuclease V subunit alpha [Alteromonas sp. BL110]RKM79269.1 exodeoxyribonuclease V subunit alpha [Alteromonas sp. BL110]
MNNNQHSVSSFFDNLFGIEAIDKFVAKEFGFIDEIAQEERFIWAGLLAYLSYMQRNGHSCIYLKDIAGTTLFKEIDTEQAIGSTADVQESESASSNHNSQAFIEQTEPEKVPQTGVELPQLTPLLKIVKSALENEQVAQLFVYKNGRLYSRRYYGFEQEVARNIVDRAAITPLTEEATEKVKQLWPAIFPTETTDQQDWQQIAVAKSLMQRFCVINGGPGTGKTYTVLRLLLALQACDKDLNIVLAAPTGKAQQRMTESIVNSIEALRGKVDDTALDNVPTAAVTLHRLLGLREHGVSTKYNQHNPLAADVLIVDEASMVDLALMTRIVRALPDHARLYFIGDADQLPAVELGNVLEQLVSDTTSFVAEENASPSSENSLHSPNDPLSLGGVPSLMRQHIATLCPHLPMLPVNERAKSYVATLQAPQRFKGQVAKVATAIQQGNAGGALAAIAEKGNENSKTANLASHIASNLDSNNKPRLKDGVCLWPEDEVSSRDLHELAKESFFPIFDADNAGEALNRLNYVRWLTPVRKGAMGVEGLNSLVFDAIKHKIKRREGHFYQGQPIMIVKNHHPQRLSNGEVGVIWPDSTGKLYAWFYQDAKSPDQQASSGTGENATGVQHQMQKQALRSISLSRVPQFETVYAMTIHKSQGSEFNHVVLMLPKPDSDKAANLFHRGLVYTGLTRAKGGCLIISDNTTFSHMVQRVDKRYSGLSEAISLHIESTSNATTEIE